MIAGCSPGKEARNIAWATRESALTELGYLWIQCLAKRLASILLPHWDPMNNSCSAAWPDRWMLSLWQLSKKGMSNPSRQQLQTPVKGFPLLASIQKWVLHPALGLSPTSNPVFHAWAVESLSRLHKLSWYFANCSCSSLIASYISLLPAEMLFVPGTCPFPSVSQPAPNAGSWVVLRTLPAVLGVATGHTEGTWSLFLPYLPSKSAFKH